MTPIIRKLVQKRSMSLTVVLLISLFTLAQQFGWLQVPMTPQIGGGRPGFYTVDHFVDGDTIAVNMNGKLEKVRFIGVDTPETHKPNSPVQCYGPAAAAYTKQLIGQSQVRLEADSLNTNRDRYNRLLRYVYLPDNTLLNQKIIENGYGFAYTQFPFSKKEVFAASQDQAKQAGRGLWGNCQVIVENNGRQQTNNL